MNKLHDSSPSGCHTGTNWGGVGALIAGYLLNQPSINQNVFNLNALVISLLGAIILLAIVNSVLRGRLR